MRIEHLRRWQWAVIGLIVGLVVGWIWSNIQTSGGLTDAVTLGSEQFERGLAGESLQGHPKIKNIVVHQEKGRYLIQMKVLEPDPNDPHPKNPRHYRYLSERLNPTAPFLPSIREAPSQTVMWRVNPSAVSKVPRFGKRQDTGALPLWINGAAVGIENMANWLRLKDWEIQPGEWCEPGSRAQLGLALRPANYQMLIVLSQQQDSPVSADDLSVTLNGHPTEPLVSVKKASGAGLETRLPREAFVEGDIQMLEFSRKTKPVKIWEVRLIDPQYSVVDYLTYAKQKNPEISFSSAWWDTPRMKYILCGVGGVLFFGGIWPTLVKWLTGRGAADAGPQEEYDLDRFQGEGPRKPAVAPQLTGDELSELEEELSGSPASRGAAPGQATSQPPRAPAQLSNAPIAPVVLAGNQGPAEYQGEFYPVVRPGGEKHEGQKQ